MRPTSPKSLWLVSLVGVVAMGLASVIAGCDKSELAPNLIKPLPEIETRDLCSGPGVPCESAAPCCLRQCDAKTGTCAAPMGFCKDGSEACESSAECCSGVCRSGKCYKRLCTADRAACKTDDECCGGSCVADPSAQGGKICAPLNAACRTSGNPCGQDSECCSNACRNGVCQGAASFCKQSGDACGSDANCCSGTCNKAGSAKLGTCGPVAGAAACKVEGQYSNATSADTTLPKCGGDCCSKSAAIGASGLAICQSPSGCHPAGEACAEDTDCCGGTAGARCAKAAPTDKLGRCEAGGACRAAGSLCALTGGACGGDSSCCSGNAATTAGACQLDLLGVARCTLSGETCAARPSRVGEACATSADCCGKPCVPVGADAGAVATGDAGATGYACAAACVATGGTCTATSDCCTGMQCAVTPGKPTGTCVGGRGGAPAACAFTGQSCKGTTCCAADAFCNPSSERCEARSL